MRDGEAGWHALIFSSSDRPLSTLRRSFAHFANWSCALVCSRSFLLTRISDLSFLCCAIFAEWKSRRYSA